MDLRTNNDYFSVQHELIFFYEGDRLFPVRYERYLWIQFRLIFIRGTEIFVLL
jgi:hypothetical protein